MLVMPEGLKQRRMGRGRGMAAQESRVVRVIRKQLVKRSLDMLKSIAEREPTADGRQEYNDVFFDAFGRCAYSPTHPRFPQCRHSQASVQYTSGGTTKTGPFQMDQ